MKTTRSPNLVFGLALTSAVRAADITPAETKAIAEEVHLQPSDRDELRRDVCVCRGPRFRPVQSAVQRDQKIRNEPRVYTYKDTAIITPNSDTPYSFVWMDLRALADSAVGSGGGEIALLLGDALRRQYVQLRLHRQPRHRE
jgi:hypothetical protein